MLRLLPADCAIALVLWTCIIPLATLDPCDIDISPRDLHNRHPDDKIRDLEEGHNRVLVLFMTTINKGCIVIRRRHKRHFHFGSDASLSCPFLFLPCRSVSATAYLSGGQTQRRDIRDCSKKGSGVVDDRPAFSIVNRGDRAYARITVHLR